MVAESTSESADNRNASGSDRRQTILRALGRCIATRGYSKTSLTDIAVAAGMSPSHIRYYFHGKDAILESYLALTCDAILKEIQAINAADPAQWLEAFSRYFVGNPRISATRLKVMVEIFGISTHDPELSRIKSMYDATIRSILEGYFAKVGCAPGLDPASAAEIVQALEAGLKYNAAFQENFDSERARSLFLASVEALAAKPAAKKTAKSPRQDRASKP
jgi:AcrR family transcriptional regulator